MAGRRSLRTQDGFFAAPLTQGPLVAHMFPHERSPRHLRYLRDYELAIRWLEPSFLKKPLRALDARPTADGYPYGTAPLRYAEPGKAHLRAARCQERPHVCLRTDRL